MRVTAVDGVKPTSLVLVGIQRHVAAIVAAVVGHDGESASELATPVNRLVAYLLAGGAFVCVVVGMPSRLMHAATLALVCLAANNASAVQPSLQDFSAALQSLPPIVIYQAKEDYIAPPDKAGRVLKSELGNQVTYLEVPHCGHALSSERPEEVSRAVINYLRQETLPVDPALLVK